MFHLSAGALQKCGRFRRKGLRAKVGWNGAAEGLAGGDIKLGAVHAASDELTVERTHLQRRIHVPAASLDGVVSSAAIADDDLEPLDLDRFHPARRDLIRVYCANELVTQGSRPLAATGVSCPGP